MSTSVIRGLWGLDSCPARLQHKAFCRFVNPGSRRSALFMSVVAICRSPLKIFQFSLKVEVAVWGADLEARLLAYD